MQLQNNGSTSAKNQGWKQDLDIHLNTLKHSGTLKLSRQAKGETQKTEPRPLSRKSKMPSPLSMNSGCLGQCGGPCNDCPP